MSQFITSKKKTVSEVDILLWVGTKMKRDKLLRGEPGEDSTSNVNRSVFSSNSLIPLTQCNCSLHHLLVMFNIIS